MIANQEWDLLLIIEMEKERLYPERDVPILFGQFAMLFDIVPRIDFNSMLIPASQLREYYAKWLCKYKEKHYDDLPHSSLLKFAHKYVKSVELSRKAEVGYILNSKHTMNNLDEENDND